MTKLKVFIPYTRTIMRYSILLLMFLLPSIALAVSDDTALAKPLITLDQAVKQVKQNKQGKVLAAETKQMNDAPVHIIKVLTDDGRVKKIRIQAKPDK